jgi:hypothetical protein
MGRAMLAVVLSCLLIVFINFALFPIIGWWDLCIDAIPIGLSVGYLSYQLVRHCERGVR